MPDPDLDPTPEPPAARRLHVGCGRHRLEGWINVDIQLLPGVDVVADIAQGLPFREADVVFAEHFLEHLPVEAALAFLDNAHAVLRPGGWLRLSTPNLEWVVATHYHAAEPPPEGLDAIRLNRAFYGWEHRFLWDREMLERALRAAGFEKLAWCLYGESSQPFLRGLERHDRYQDDAALPHVLVVEATRGEADPAAMESLHDRLQNEFLVHLAEARASRERLEIQRLQRRLHEREARIEAFESSLPGRLWSSYRRLRSLVGSLMKKRPPPA